MAAAGISHISDDYGILAARKQGKEPHLYGVDHSSFVYLIDREGKLIGIGSLIVRTRSSTAAFRKSRST